MKFLRLLALLPFFAHAQVVDFNKVILPDNVTPPEFEERLVQLAWKNHPSNKTVLKEVEIASKERQLARWRWLDDIYANGNLNEYTLHPRTSDGTANTNVFFPRYNFGIRFSLGTFVTTPLQSRIANDNLANSQLAVNEKKLAVREQVLTGIERLKQYYKFIRIREQIYEDFRTMYLASEKKFETGEVSMDQYRAAAQAYADQKESVAEAQGNFNAARIALEALIGVSITEVKGYPEFIAALEAASKLD